MGHSSTDSMPYPAICKFAPDASAMEALGAAIGRNVRSACMVYLQGDLGAGKTTLVRGFLRGRRYEGKVKSPTYTLVEPYLLEERTIFHFDLYRLEQPEELEAIGIRDYLDSRSICLFEWPEKADGLLPAPDLHITLSILASGRHLSIQALNRNAQQVLDNAGLVD